MTFLKSPPLPITNAISDYEFAKPEPQTQSWIVSMLRRKSKTQSCFVSLPHLRPLLLSCCLKRQQSLTNDFRALDTTICCVYRGSDSQSSEQLQNTSGQSVYFTSYTSSKSPQAVDTLRSTLISNPQTVQ
eukprot:g56144.t1